MPSIVFQVALMKPLLFGILAFGIVGCSGMVTANDGNRVTVEHDFFVSIDSALDVALQSCTQAGKSKATFVVSANKNPRFAPGQGVQLSTFQCE